MMMSYGDFTCAASGSSSGLKPMNLFLQHLYRARVQSRRRKVDRTCTLEMASCHQEISESSKVMRGTL